jgi:hypothetical protein
MSTFDDNYEKALAAIGDAVNYKVAILHFSHSAARANYMEALRKRLYSEGREPHEASEVIQRWFSRTPYTVEGARNVELVCSVAAGIRGVMCKIREGSAKSLGLEKHSLEPKTQGFKTRDHVIVISGKYRNIGGTVTHVASGPRGDKVAVALDHPVHRMMGPAILSPSVLRHNSKVPFAKLKGKTRELASRYIAEEVRTGKYGRSQAVAIGISRARRERGEE